MMMAVCVIFLVYNWLVLQMWSEQFGLNTSKRRKKLSPLIG